MTNERLLEFGRYTGDFLHEIDLKTIQSVDLKTVYWLLGVPQVRITLKRVDGRVMELASSGIGAPGARSLGRALTEHVEYPRPKAEEG